MTGCTTPSDRPIQDAVGVWPSEVELRIGAVDDPDYALTFFRALEVGDDGTIYTLHPREQLVRVFDATGAAMGVIGGRGDGPGELQNAAAMGWVADTLWVLDFDGYRFNQYAADGAFLGAFSVPFVMSDDPNAPQPPRARGLLEDGTIHGAPPAFSRQIQDGTITHDTPMLMDRDGAVVDTLPAIPFGRNQWAISDPDRVRAGGMYTSQPFADGPIWRFVPGENALIVLDREAPATIEPAAFRVTKLTFAGDTVFSRTYPFEPRRVTEHEVDSLLTEMGDRIGERGFLGATALQARRWAELSLYRPAFRPGVTEMLVARDGSIWLRLGAGESAEDVWLALDADGTPRGRTTIPAGTTLLVIDPPYLWGSWQDELEVPYIVRIRVETDA